MNASPNIEREILIYLEDYSNTTFSNYSLEAVESAIQVLLGDSLIKESPFNMEKTERNDRELRVLCFMLTMDGHDAVEKIRSGA